MARFRVSAEFTVTGDRNPNVWDWETILDIEDESDHVDWSTFTLERVVDGEDEPCAGCNAVAGEPCRPGCLSGVSDGPVCDGEGCVNEASVITTDVRLCVDCAREYVKGDVA